METSDSKRLWEILGRAQRGETVSADDLSFAESCLDEADPMTQTNACTIIFRCSKSRSAKSRALDIVEKLCANPSEEGYVLGLLILMSFVPSSALEREDGPLPEFLARCARSSRTGIRVNASVALRSLRGPEAISLLKLLTKDSDSCVRENARTMLKLGMRD